MNTRLFALLLVSTFILLGCGIYANRQTDDMRSLAKSNQCEAAEQILPSILRGARGEDTAFRDSAYRDVASCYGRVGNSQKAEQYSQLAKRVSGRAELRRAIDAGATLCCCGYSGPDRIKSFGPNFNPVMGSSVEKKVMTKPTCAAQRDGQCVRYANAVRGEKYQFAVTDLFERCDDVSTWRLLQRGQ